MKIGLAMVCALLLATVASAAPAPEKMWITVDQQAYEALQQIAPGTQAVLTRVVVAGLHHGVDRIDRISVVQIDTGLLGAFSEKLRHDLNRHGGFMAFDSKAEAIASLKPMQRVAGATRPSYGIGQQAIVTPMLAQQSASNIVATISDLSALQNRYYNGSFGKQATDLLVAKWSSLAAGRSDVTVERVNRGSDQMASVVLTITGTSAPNQVLVLGGHLDSIAFDGDGPPYDNVRAPGADDDASGIASITEVLRVLMANNFRPQRTLKLMAYAGEEFGLYGSKFIAGDYASRNVDVIGVLQLDMTNYKGSSGDMYLVDDYTDAQQNQFLRDLASAYLPDLSVQTTTCGYACSDHASWTQQGYFASMPFEAAFGEDSPYIHSQQDTLANADSTGKHALKFSRLALAFAVELAGVASTPAPTAECVQAWSASHFYRTGAQVSRAGVNYRAVYWTWGADPATNHGPAGTGKPWAPTGNCGNNPTPQTIPRGGPASTSTPTPNADAHSAGAAGTPTRLATLTPLRAAMLMPEPQGFSATATVASSAWRQYTATAEPTTRAEAEADATGCEAASAAGAEGPATTSPRADNAATAAVAAPASDACKPLLTAATKIVQADVATPFASSAEVLPVRLSACAPWSEGETYNAGQTVTYGGQGYAARVTHTAWQSMGWSPAASPNLWTRSDACK